MLMGNRVVDRAPRKLVKDLNIEERRLARRNAKVSEGGDEVEEVGQRVCVDDENDCSRVQ